MQDYKFFYPSADLSPYIRHYWTLQLKDTFNLPLQRVTPTGFTEITFHFQEQPVQLTVEGDLAQPAAMICGLRRNYFDLRAGKTVDLLSVVFQPAGMAMFFNMPLVELAEQTRPVGDISIQLQNELYPSLQEAENDIVRIMLVEKFLRRQIREENLFPVHRMQVVIDHLQKTKGMVSVRELSEVACLGKKQFERQFSSLVGLMPKQYLKVVRFQSALYHYQQHAPANLTQLAFECGYYDQAHFIQDFKTFTGFTPRKYFDAFTAQSDFFDQ